MAGIAVSEETPWVSYTASGGQTSFAYTWPVYDDSHLAVYKNGTLLTLTTHYTVTGVESESGGNVVLVTGATADDAIVIAGAIPLERTSQYDVDRPFGQGQLDEDLDRIALMLNRLKLATMRSPQRVLKDWPGVQMTLPDPDEDKVLGWDEATGQLINVDPGTVGEAGDDFNATIPGGTRTVTTLQAYLSNNAVCNVKDYGALGDGVTDDTAAIQLAIDAAAPNRTTNSWSLEVLRQVYFPCSSAGYLIQGYLIIPEGVELVGESVYGSRLFLDDAGWTTGNAKIRDANYDGSTTSKNFGFRNLCFMCNPNDPDAAAALSDVDMIEMKKVTEVHFINCRFVNHTYEAQFAPYSIVAVSYDADGVTSIKLKECIGVNIESCGFDRGNTHIHAVRDSGGANNNGIAWSRIHNCYFYASSNYAVRLGIQCELNNVSGNIVDAPSARSGNAGRGFWIENSDATPSEHNTISNNVVRTINEAFMCDGHENQIVGNSFRTTQAGTAAVKISGDLNTFISKTESTGTTYEIEVSGRSNLILPAPHKENANAYGETGGASAAPDNIVLFQDRMIAAGKQWFRSKTEELTLVDTYYDFVSIYMPQTFTGIVVTVHVNMNLSGVGMKAVRQGFFVSRGAGALAGAALTTNDYETGTPGELVCNVAAVDDDTVKVQVKRTAGNANDCSVIIEVDGQAQSSRQYSYFLKDLTV